MWEGELLLKHQRMMQYKFIIFQVPKHKKFHSRSKGAGHISTIEDGMPPEVFLSDIHLT